MSIIVLHSQTLVDIAIQHCGTVEALVDIAVLNGISITEELAPGQNLELPKKDYGFAGIVAFFKVNKKQPATALTDENNEVIEGASGIDFWIIEDNFIVQ